MAKDHGELIKKVIKQIKFKTPSRMEDPSYIDKKIKEEQKKEVKEVKTEEKEKEASKGKSQGERITDKIKEIKFKTPQRMNDPKYLDKSLKHLKDKVKEKIKKKD